jgi:hypothetical protein
MNPAIRVKRASPETEVSIDAAQRPVSLSIMKAGGSSSFASHISRISTERTTALDAWRLAVLLLAVASAPLDAQTIRAIPTYHNIGVHLEFASVPPASALISMAIREENAPGQYRTIHPLSRISSNRFAGSAFGLKSDTAYSIQLSSPAFAFNRVLEVRTRSELLSSATQGVYHVSPVGNDANDGRSLTRAFRTLRRALDVASAGEQLLLHAGRYHEGDVEVYPSSTGEREATAVQPIVIESAPNEQATLDGSDTEFAPHWALFDSDHGVYRTPTVRQPYHAYLNGGHLYHFGVLDHLRTNRWGQLSGFFADGTHLYVRLPDGGPIATNQITLPRFTFALLLSASYYQIRGLEFCYYGYDRDPAAIVLENASSNTIERCAFHHTGTGISIRHDSIHNTIQQCTFNEWPVDSMMWDAIKQGEPFGSEPYETGGVVVTGDHTAYYGNVIRSNRFEHLFDGAHLFSDDAAAPTEDLDFHDNLVLNCGDDGIETDGVGSNCRIYSNVFSNFLTGISVAPAALGPTYIFRNALLRWRSVPSTEGEDGRFYGYPVKLNHQMRDDPWTSWVYLYHNSCFTDGPGLDGFQFNYYWWSWTNIVSRNNIYVGTRYALCNYNEQCPIDFDYDALFTTGPKPVFHWDRNDFADLGAFTQATGQEHHGLFVDPGFLAPGGARLRSDSPLVDRGVRIPGINDDYFGSAPDVGAFEAASAPVAFGLEWVNGMAQSTWSVTSRLSYQLEFTADLSPPRWAAVGESVQAPESLLVMRHTNLDSSGFYRLRSDP